MSFSLGLILFLLLAAGAMMVAEWRGLKTTLKLEMKGDLKRESRFLGQYGQSACTPLAVLLVWQLDPRRWGPALSVAVAVTATALVVMVLKRLFGRVRPGRENAGRFLGPSWKHANYRESFPSSHSACAFALSTALAAPAMYPKAAITFWLLAAACAIFRYLLDAHWPSDILAGAAVGIGVAQLTLTLLPPV